MNNFGDSLGGCFFLILAGIALVILAYAGLLYVQHIIAVPA